MLDAVGCVPQIDVAPSEAPVGADLDRDAATDQAASISGGIPEASGSTDVADFAAAAGQGPGSRENAGGLRGPAERPLAPEVMQSIDDESAVLRELRQALESSPDRTGVHSLREFLGEIEQQYQALEKSSQAYLSGRDFSQQELIFLQVRIQGVAQQIELLSKGIEHAVSGVKTVAQTNV